MPPLLIAIILGFVALAGVLAVLFYKADVEEGP